MLLNHCSGKNISNFCLSSVLFIQGMEVEHDLSNFTDGKTEILVIKDKEILDEDQDDVLMSYDVEQVEKGRKFQDDTKKVGANLRFYS